MSVPFPLARNLRAPRTLALLGALLLCLAALLARPIPLQRQGVALLAVVYGAATGYGPEGPDSHKPAFAYTGEARSGSMWWAGPDDGVP